MMKLGVLLLGGSMLAAAAPAVAQDAATATPDEIVVTAQRANQTQVMRGGEVGVLGDKPASDVPFSIKSYNAALILNQQPQTLGDVLQNDPSIRTTYSFGNAAELFVIRGFPIFGDDVGLDGLYGIAPRQLIAPELYDQVQVLNGASAFLNGAAPGGSAIGGNVNLVTKRADDRDLTRATANYTSGAHFGGSADVSRRSADGRFGVRLNGVYRSGDVAIHDEFRRTATAGAAFDFRGERLRLSLDIDYQRVQVRHLRPKVTIGTATIPRVPRAAHNYAQRFTYTTLRDIFGVARAEYDLADNALLYATFGARDGSERGIYDGITVTNATTGAATGTALFVPRTDNNEAAQAGVRVKLAAGGITQEFNLGGSYIWQVNRNAFDFRYGPGFAGFPTNIYDTPQSALPSSSFVGGDLDHPFPVARTRLGSAFASDTIGAFDDHVLLTAGLRLQAIKVTRYSYYNGGGFDGGYDEDAVTPVVGLVVKPAAGVSLFANRIESLQQGPTAPATGFNAVAGATQPVSNLGEVFPPYRSVQYEVGGKLSVGPINASLALYTIRLPIGQVEPDPDRPGFVRYGLFGNQRNRGIELSVDGELAKGLRVIAGGSVIEAKVRDTPGGIDEGNHAPGVPKYTANANVEWDLPFLRGATLTGRVVQTGRQKVNLDNTLGIPSWTRVDLGARYVALVGRKPVTFRVTVDNVADRRYWASAFDSFSNALLQGEPRTFKLSTSIDL